MASIGQTQHLGSQSEPPQHGALSPEYRSSEEYLNGSIQPHTLPMPSKIQNAPLSPVRTTFQQDEWAQASTVQIENMSQRMKDARISGHTTDSQQYRDAGPEDTVQHDEAVNRQQYAGNVERHHSQHGVLDRGSPKPYNDDPRYSTDRGRNTNGRRSDESSNSGNIQVVPPLQYHHLPHRSVDTVQQDLYAQEQQPNRHLTPLATNMQNRRRSYAQRPASTYSAYDTNPQRRSPGSHAYSPYSENGQGRGSQNGTPEGSRPGSYVDMLNGQYPQQAPMPMATFDNSDLRAVVGNNASLLSTTKTLQMYRDNLKKQQDPETHYTFALLLIETARTMMPNEPASTPTVKKSPKPMVDLESPHVETEVSTSADLIREAKSILTKLANNSWPYAQYYLADGYWTGFFNNKGKPDFAEAFKLFVAASKHGHAESSYRAAICYEFGWGTRKDIMKAEQFYRQAATKNHPGAMTRLGRAGLIGDLGQKAEREAIKWLKRATDSADVQHNEAPFYLGQLYENGWDPDVFKDESYAAQLHTQAADLGHMEAAFRLGEAYEHGRLNCPNDPSLSVHFYTLAAQKGHSQAMFNLCAWYMVGAEPVLEKDENEAYEWAKKAAESGEFYRDPMPPVLHSALKRLYKRSLKTLVVPGRSIGVLEFLAFEERNTEIAAAPYLEDGLLVRRFPLEFCHNYTEFAKPWTDTRIQLEAQWWEQNKRRALLERLSGSVMQSTAEAWSSVALAYDGMRSSLSLLSVLGAKTDAPPASAPIAVRVLDHLDTREPVTVGMGTTIPNFSSDSSFGVGRDGEISNGTNLKEEKGSAELGSKRDLYRLKLPGSNSEPTMTLSSEVGHTTRAGWKLKLVRFGSKWFYEAPETGEVDLTMVESYLATDTSVVKLSALPETIEKVTMAESYLASNTTLAESCVLPQMSEGPGSPLLSEMPESVLPHSPDIPKLPELPEFSSLDVAEVGEGEPSVLPSSAYTYNS